MKAIVLENDDKRNLSFIGEQIASATTHEHSGPRNGRWLDLALYRTQSGKLICARVGRTCWQGEHDRHEAQVAADEAAVVEFFGLSDAAKEIYDEAGIVADEAVD